MAFPFVVVWGKGGSWKRGVKSLSLPLSSGRRERSRWGFFLHQLEVKVRRTAVFASCQLLWELLLDPLLHWRAAVTDAAAAAQTLPISLPRSLSPSLSRAHPPPPPRTLTSSPSSRSSCFTPLQWLVSHTGGHCRIHGPVYSAFSSLCVLCVL